MEFTGGDMSLLPKLYSFAEETGSINAEWMEKQVSANGFIEPALEVYFEALGYDPTAE